MRTGNHTRAARRGPAAVLTLLTAAAILSWFAGKGAPRVRADEPKIIEGASVIKQLDAPQAYAPKDNLVEIELSQYAGYAGLIAANGGLEPNDNSVFSKKYHYKLRIKLSEAESWSALNAGKMAASATTADVLAVYGKQLKVVVPAQIGYSRGADAIVVRSDVAKINGLKGKVLSTAQFTESDFLIRYLAQEAGLGVNMMKNLDAKIDPEKVNLVFCDDGEAAGEVFLKDVKDGSNKLAGCVTWEPETSKVVDEAKGKAKVLTTNRNLLIVADILIVNKGFADAHPEMVCGLVDGLLDGNRMVRDNPTDATLKVVGDAFKWDAAKTKQQLATVHLSNLPENQAFFSGAMDAAGSFSGIYQSAVQAYGSMITNAPDPDTLLSTKCLAEAENSGAYKDQKIAIAPIRAEKTENVERDPLLSKDIRFFFQPNSSDLDMSKQDNLDNLKDLKQLLNVSPGSHLLLRGHVDNAMIPKFRRDGGEALVTKMAGEAQKLSEARASEIKKQLIGKEGVPAERLETVGRGWMEPAGTDSNKNRRVEAQWFTLE